MTTRTKLNIAIYLTSIMMLLNVFSKPLQIPELFQWILIIGVFVPIVWIFYLIKKQKFEKQQQSNPTEIGTRPATDQKQNIKNKLVLMMTLGSVVGLCAPLWMPLTGTTLGVKGDFICGVIGTFVICIICGIRLRKI